MALILSLETSTDVCSVALHRDGALLNEQILRQPQAHAAMLSPLIQKSFSETGLDFSVLDSVCISAGPGSYTGLRIGASTAKGFCYALDIPLISVPTLDLLAYQASKANGIADVICPMIDARRMEVYCRLFDRTLNPLSEVEAMVLEENSFAELLKREKVLFAGNGSGKFQEIVKSDNALFDIALTPEASALGELAGVKYERGEFADLVLFKPLYLKEFVAKKARPLLD